MMISTCEDQWKHTFPLPPPPRYCNSHSHSTALANGLGSMFVVLYILLQQGCPQLTTHSSLQDGQYSTRGHYSTQDGHFRTHRDAIMMQLSGKRKRKGILHTGQPSQKHALPVSLSLCCTLDIPSSDLSL